LLEPIRELERRRVRLAPAQLEVQIAIVRDRRDERIVDPVESRDQPAQLDEVALIDRHQAGEAAWTIDALRYYEAVGQHYAYLSTPRQHATRPEASPRLDKDAQDYR